MEKKKSGLSMKYVQNIYIKESYMKNAPQIYFNFFAYKQGNNTFVNISGYVAEHYEKK